MKKKILCGITVLAIAALAAFNLNLSSDENVVSSLTLANVEALAQETHPTIYNRHPFQCTITGNGKVKIAGGTIVEVKGSLSFDGGISCSSSGNMTCTPVECAQLWQWVF
ncbi:NVEALA domain-containing protein [Proteiniphilum saccharofermentans]|uniref:NVEALA domain-containing protein n=1 Tax=Proteiniphilum saccharofermentans TaxID=1642647 RepID=UPI0028ABDBFD|nr:NVEALA domain-containing protein [Proteiniphilum saccharofermentans]